jgi:HEAT repeat protein
MTKTQLLVNMWASAMSANPNHRVLKKARNSLITIGKPAVFSLSWALRNSTVPEVRYEAAKALEVIHNAKAIPSLVKALDDPDHDVARLASDALIKFRKSAWPELLNALIRRGQDSFMLRQGALHVLKKQHEEGFNDMLEVLTKSLEYEKLREEMKPAASIILERLSVERGKQENFWKKIGQKNSNQTEDYHHPILRLYT